MERYSKFEKMHSHWLAILAKKTITQFLSFDYFLQSAAGYEDREELSKHASQQGDYALWVLPENFYVAYNVAASDAFVILPASWAEGVWKVICFAVLVLRHIKHIEQTNGELPI